MNEQLISAAIDGYVSADHPDLLATMKSGGYEPFVPFDDFKHALSRFDLEDDLNAGCEGDEVIRVGGKWFTKDMAFVNRTTERIKARDERRVVSG